MKKFIWLGLFIFFLACGDLSKNNDSEELNYNVPDQESWNTEIVVSQSGQKKAIIYTNHLRKYNKLDKILMDDSVHANFYDSLGRRKSQLTSDRARINTKKYNIYASDNVIVESDSGVTLFADSLRWLNQVDLILSDAPVTFITKEGDTLKGNSFQSNARLENWQLSNPTGVTPRELKTEL